MCESNIKISLLFNKFSPHVNWPSENNKFHEKCDIKMQKKTNSTDFNEISVFWRLNNIKYQFVCVCVCVCMYVSPSQNKLAKIEYHVKKYIQFQFKSLNKHVMPIDFHSNWRLSAVSLNLRIIFIILARTRKEVVGTFACALLTVPLNTVNCFTGQSACGWSSIGIQSNQIVDDCHTFEYSKYVEDTQ